MSKLIATVIATIALLFGGAVALAAPASADDPVVCSPKDPCDDDPTGGVVQTNVDDKAAIAALQVEVADLTSRLAVADGLANEYRVTIAQQAALIERLRARGDRQAATINRQRDVIERLRERLAAR